MNNSDREESPEIIAEDAIVRRTICAHSGHIITESWFDEFGNLHALQNPAYREFDPVTGRVKYERWMENGEEHRWPAIGPSETFWDLQHDRIVQETYRQSDRLHRDHNRPARIWYSPHTGVPVREEFWVHGKLHRDNGLAAVIEYDENRGDVVKLEYYAQGHKISEPAQTPKP